MILTVHSLLFILTLTMRNRLWLQIISCFVFLWSWQHWEMTIKYWTDFNALTFARFIRKFRVTFFSKWLRWTFIFKDLKSRMRFFDLSTKLKNWGKINFLNNPNLFLIFLTHFLFDNCFFERALRRVCTTKIYRTGRLPSQLRKGLFEKKSGIKKSC